MQKVYFLELYSLDGKKTYLIREPNNETKGSEAVLITDDPGEVANFISNK